jgi:hypothetical protein
MADKKTRDKVENLKPTHKRTASRAKYELVKEGDLWFIKSGSKKLGPFSNKPTDQWAEQYVKAAFGP